MLAMLLLVPLLSAIVIASGQAASLGVHKNCDLEEMDVCVESIPDSSSGFPKTKEELDSQCRAFNIGMSCIQHCIQTNGQRAMMMYQNIVSEHAFMRYLCANETTALRREFLKEHTCWAQVTAEWSDCVNELHDALEGIKNHAKLLSHFSRDEELCCARDDFFGCVTQVKHRCSATADNLLKRMARVLSQDLIVCDHPHAYCAAPPAAVIAPLLMALSTVLQF